MHFESGGSGQAGRIATALENVGAWEFINF